MTFDSAPAHKDHANGPRRVRRIKATGPLSRMLLESLEQRQLLAGILRPDHIVVVIEQDRASDMIGNSIMPYLNQLASTGLTYSNSHGVTHPTLPNMLALFSGSTHGVTDNGRHRNFTGPTLAKSLFDAGFSFSGYSENLPFDGSQAPEAGNADYPDLYTRNLNPMAQFPEPVVGSTINKTFAAFSALPTNDYSSLPTVSFIIPNNLHNTHGSNENYPWAGSPDEENNDLLRKWGDDWLKQNLDGYLQWAKQNNSLLIVTQDEERWVGGTADTITTVVNGDRDLFVPGVNSGYINHYNLLRTIEDMYGLPLLGQSANVAPMATNALGQLRPDAPAEKAPTTTTLSSSSASATIGSTITFTAAVSAIGLPTGAVTFMNGSTILGAATLDSSGIATFTTSALAAGSHSITAVYGSDANFASSTSQPLNQQINKALTSTSLVSSAASSVTGQGVRFTATVASSVTGIGLPTGTVQFLIDGNAFGSPVAISNGTAISAFTTSLSQGPHTITAIYSGDSKFAQSQSPGITQTVSQAATRTTVTGPASAPSGQSITFSATVAALAPGAGTPTGSVQFRIDGVNFGSPIALINGIATSAAISSLSLGAHTVTAIYSSDSRFLASTAANVAVAIRPQNDNFSGRGTISGSSANFGGSSVGGTKEAGEPIHAGNPGGKSVWWSWTAPAAGTVTLATAGSSFDTLLAVYSGTAVSALASVASNNNDPAGGTASKVTFAVTAGKVYQIAVDGAGGASGNIALSLNLAIKAPAAPTNVVASNGLYNDKVRITWTAAAGASSYEIWRATSNRASRAAKIGVSSTTLAYDTTATPGTVYYYWIKAVNAGGASGFSDYNSGYRSTATLVNNSFASRQPIDGASATIRGTNVGATRESGEPTHAGVTGGRSVWFTWTAPASGTLMLNTRGSSFDTLLAVYTGSAVNALSPVSGGSNNNDPAGGTTASSVTFAVTAGVTYNIAVDGVLGASGSIVLNLNLL